MTGSDLIGFIGVALILIAYFLQLNKKLDSDGKTYILLNIAGASLACIASIWINYYPFVILEGTWATVSIVAFIKHLQHARKGNN